MGLDYDAERDRKRRSSQAALRDAQPGRERSTLKKKVGTLRSVAFRRGIFHSPITYSKSGTIYVALSFDPKGPYFVVRFAKDDHPGRGVADWNWKPGDNIDVIVRTALSTLDRKA